MDTLECSRCRKVRPTRSAESSLPAEPASEDDAEAFSECLVEASVDDGVHEAVGVCNVVAEEREILVPIRIL